MDSSNIGTNRIVPIETIEMGVSSNSEMGNKIVPFSKTESPFRKVAFVRQKCKTTLDPLPSMGDACKTDSIHYISWIFGMLLTFAALFSTLIVPWHNVLKEPFYMYELYVY